MAEATGREQKPNPEGERGKGQKEKGEERAFARKTEGAVEAHPRATIGAVAPRLVARLRAKVKPMKSRRKTSRAPLSWMLPEALWPVTMAHRATVESIIKTNLRLGPCQVEGVKDVNMHRSEPCPCTDSLPWSTNSNVVDKRGFHCEPQTSQGPSCDASVCRGRHSPCPERDPRV